MKLVITFHGVGTLAKILKTTRPYVGATARDKLVVPTLLRLHPAWRKAHKDATNIDPLADSTVLPLASHRSSVIVELHLKKDFVASFLAGAAKVTKVKSPEAEIARQLERSMTTRLNYQGNRGLHAPALFEIEI